MLVTYHILLVREDGFFIIRNLAPVREISSKTNLVIQLLRLGRGTHAVVLPQYPVEQMVALVGTDEIAIVPAYYVVAYPNDFLLEGVFFVLTTQR